MNDAPVEVGGKNSAVGMNSDEPTAPLKPLISVIVPIYNVEKYVRKCLDSLVNQTMRQIEVIAIDDGSTDESGRIADEYVSEEFPIFRVIHTENRGLSTARNRGIDEAKAEWIMFVDSDDWVSPDFCRIPYEAALDHQSDLVIFDYNSINQSGKLKRYKAARLQSGVVTNEHVIQHHIAWNKLYKRLLFDNIRYPENLVYEDIATTHKIIHKAERIYQCDKGLYYYRKRRGSISRSNSNKADAYISRLQQYVDLKNLGYLKK